MTPKELAPILHQRAPEIIRHLLPNGKEHNGEWIVGSVGGEAGKSMRVRMEGDKAGVWLDFDSGEKGDIIELWKRARNLSFKDTIREVHQYLDIPEDDEKDIKSQLTWKRVQQNMGTGTEHDLRDVAALRRLPTIEGLRNAVENGHLFFGPVGDGREGGTFADYYSWIVTDNARRGAQARRMDGKPWADGQKAKTIHGTTGRWPIGIADSALPEIAFCEGGPDFLAAYTAVAQLGVSDRIQPVSMFGSQQVIHPDALPLFRNKTVWMFLHNDENYSGLHGAMKWERALRTIGTRVFPFDFGRYPGVKDLNDFVTAIAARPSVLDEEFIEP